MSLKKWMNRSRALFLMLAFLLVFSPLSVLADTKEGNELTYVALGDSLAAGMLANRSIGEGYAGNIASELEDQGYDVTLENTGIPGATSDIVKNKMDMDKLANADLVTLSVGVNDLLFPQLSLLEGLEPVYFSPEAVQQIKDMAKEEINNVIDGTTTTTNEINNAFQHTVKEVKELQSNLNENKAMIMNLLSEDEFNQLLATMMKIEFELNGESNHLGAKGNIENTTSHLEDAKANSNANNELNEVIADLNATLENFNNISNQMDSIIEVLGDNNHPLADYLQPMTASIEEAKAKTTAAITIVGEANNAFALYIEKLDEINKKAALAATITTEFEGAGNKIPGVAKNIATILGKIKEVNPDVDIYVMGYYNAFPNVDPEMQEPILDLLAGLNASIQGATVEAGATYIPTIAAFEGNYDTYLPIKNEIHPSDAGYQALADRFISSFGNKYPEVEEIPDILLLGFDKNTPVFAGEKVLIGTPPVAGLQLPEDLPEGTKLKVSEKAEKHDENLTPAGSVLNFEFTYPEGSEYTSKEGFNLYMKYDSKVDTESIDIYHYEDNAWVAQNGELTEVDGQPVISLKVNNFSSYGVFSKVKKEDNKNNNENVKKEDESDLVVEVEDGDDEIDDATLAEGDSALESSIGILPSTATNYYNPIAVGLLIMLAGVGVWIYQHRKSY